jgi:hypothetical protein
LAWEVLAAVALVFLFLSPAFIASHPSCLAILLSPGFWVIVFLSVIMVFCALAALQVTALEERRLGLLLGLAAGGAYLFAVFLGVSLALLY